MILANLRFMREIFFSFINKFMFKNLGNVIYINFYVELHEKRYISILTLPQIIV